MKLHGPTMDSGKDIIYSSLCGTCEKLQTEVYIKLHLDSNQQKSTKK